MNHLLIYQNTAVAAGAIDSDIPAVVDQKITVQNNHFILPQDSRVLAAYVLETSAIRAKLVTPYLRTISPSYIDPFDRADIIPALPNIAVFHQNGPTLKQGDETAIQVSNNLGAATERCTVGLWVDLKGPSLVPGPYTTIRLTGTPAATINAWQLVNLIFDTVLPYGKYAIAGMKVAGAATGLARLVLPEDNFRPGCTVMALQGRNDWWFFRRGNMGSFGEFWSNANPMLEVFALASLAAGVEVYLDVVKVQ